MVEIQFKNSNNVIGNVIFKQDRYVRGFTGSAAIDSPLNNTTATNLAYLESVWGINNFW